VLDHVHPEKLAGEYLDWALKGEQDGAKAQPEGNGAPPGGCRRVIGPCTPCAADQVQDRGKLDAKQHGGLERPVRKENPRHEGSDEVED
jgi:hypothetical protein